MAGSGWYEPLLDLLPSPFLLIRPDSARVFFANRAAHRLAGGSFPLESDRPEYRRVAAGERLENVRVEWDTATGTRSLVASGGIVVPPGRPPVAVLTFDDVTDHEASRRRADALAEAGGLLAGSLDFDATLELIAGVAVPRLADACFVELPRADGAIQRIGAPDAVPPGESLRVPLRSGGRVIGDLVLVNAGSGRRFGAADTAAAQELADRCGLHLENARLYGELASARDELEAILAGVADAVTVQDANGRLVYVNEAAVRLLGFPDRASLLSAPGIELARRFEMLGEDGQPLAVDQLPGRRALAGEEPEPMTVRYRVPGTAEVRWSRVKARPMRSADGSVTRAINVIEDITDLKQVEETQRLLAEAGRVLAGSLDYEDTLRRVAWLAVPDLADWCMVDVFGDRGLERVAVAHADPARAELAARMQGVLINPSAAIGPAAVARSGRAELHPAVDNEHLRKTALNPAHYALISVLGVRSACSVPMTVRGERLGVMTLSTTDSGRRLGPEQFAVLEELGRRAAVAVDSARLHRQRSAIARTLQNSLLPPVLPEIAGIETAALYRAAGEGTDVGGDFYDLFTVAEDEWIAVIGDVCGKGAEAAAVTALARYTIRTAAVRRRSPAAILRWLNDAMRRQELDGRFCTIACVHLDTSRPAIRVTVACGGHPPALLRRADGSAEEVGSAGTLLGLVSDPELSDQRTELAAGDAIVLYTDGITEARAPHRIIESADLLAALRALPAGSPQRIVDRLAALAIGDEGTPPRDDIAILALSARG